MSAPETGVALEAAFAQMRQLNALVLKLISHGEGVGLAAENAAMTDRLEGPCGEWLDAPTHGETGAMAAGSLLEPPSRQSRQGEAHSTADDRGGHVVM